MSGQLDVVLAARAHRDGRALRTSLFRHRRLARKPLALVFWQLGAEPFSAAAIAMGQEAAAMRMAVAGDPRNRELAFHALLDLGRWFNPRFEAPAEDREEVPSRTRERERARTAPQVLVPNRATIELIGRLGRRLVYLPTDGDRAADPALVRLGLHFQFLARQARVPGQQLIVSMTDILADHWATAQSAFERASLAALDAFIAPPPGQHGFDAAADAERRPVGPVPGDEDNELEPAVERFNAERRGETALATIRRLLGPIERHYRPLLAHTWSLLWRCRDREAAYPEAASVERRWDDDREAYTQHIDEVARSIRRRTRQSPRQAARLLHRLENAQSLLETEEACDDPLRMIPYLVAGKAIAGKVVAIDVTYRELATKRMMPRPLVTLELEEACVMPEGKELWWSETPGSRPFEIHRVSSRLVTLKATSSKAALPVQGDEACFSVLHIFAFTPTLPQNAPWTHQAAAAAGPESIEEDAAS